jgi:transcriptional regulator with XRE-family HTH domain
VHAPLARRLRMLRAERDLGLLEAADMLGVNRHTLRELETGKRLPYGPTLRKLSEGYGVSIADLLAEEPREAPAPKIRALHYFPLDIGDETRFDDYKEYLRTLNLDALNRHARELREEYGRAIQAGDSAKVADLYARGVIVGQRIAELDPPFARVKVSMGKQSKRVEVEFLREPTPEELAKLQAQYPEYTVVENRGASEAE